MTPECVKTFVKWWRSSKSYTRPTSDLNSLNERQHSEQKELPGSSGTDRKKLDSSFRLAFPMTLQSPAMHTDDTVRSGPGPTRSYLTPGTKEAGNRHLHFRQSTAIWNEDLFYYGIHWMLAFKMLSIVMSRPCWIQWPYGFIVWTFSGRQHARILVFTGTAT